MAIKGLQKMKKIVAPEQTEKQDLMQEYMDDDQPNID